ncbi:protein Red [Nephila pilipes]|uniref:Protein Red n=1 Tax=Nephila pilipes TaxID=299642 RepID=A0A8X6QD02_NEPPI|nr:protein Red [Nephila pilipes]
MNDEKLKEKQGERVNKWDNILSSEYVENAEDRSKDKLLLDVHKADDSRLKAKLTSKLVRDVSKSYVEYYHGAPEEYCENVSNKEALLKAAFQYDVKMADCRITRRTGIGKRDEKLNGLLLRNMHFVSRSTEKVQYFHMLSSYLDHFIS